MKTSLSVDLLLYGGMLLGLGVLAQHWSVQAVTAAQWVGCTGGVVSGLLGVLGLRGCPVRRWSIVAMAVLSLVLLAQTVTGWVAVRAEVEAASTAALVQTVLWVFAAVQLLNLIQDKERFPFNANREQHDVNNERR